MSLTTIKAKIIELIETVASIEAVFDYGKNTNTEEIAAYPMVVVMSNGITSRIETNRDNLRTYSFNIWILIQSEAASNSASQATLEGAVEDIQNLMASADNIDLGGLVHYVNPPNASFIRADVGGSNVALWANLVLECNKLINIYSL